MKTYIALLRGINVSGQKIIKMDRLKSLFESLQYPNVRTYIQSGNVLFESAEDDRDLHSRVIRNAITEEFGFDVPIIVRTVRDLEEIVSGNPFEGTVLSGEEKLYVTFLAEAPQSEAIANLESYKNEVDDFRILNQEVYILCRGPYGKSVFSNTFVEKKLKISATTRNWETVNKLIKLSRS